MVFFCNHCQQAWVFFIKKTKLMSSFRFCWFPHYFQDFIITLCSNNGLFSCFLHSSCFVLFPIKRTWKCIWHTDAWNTCFSAQWNTHVCFFRTAQNFLLTKNSQNFFDVLWCVLWLEITVVIFCVYFSGRVPKINMLRPEFSLTISFELIRLIFMKLSGKSIAKKKEQ